jgi:cytoskeletal protein RodZ
MSDDQKRAIIILSAIGCIILVIVAVIVIKHIKGNNEALGGSQSTQYLTSSSDSNGSSSTTGSSTTTGSSSTTTATSDKDANGCYTPATVRNHYGETACVDFNVGYTSQDSAGTKFIDQLTNYTAGFVGYIPWNSSANDINLSQLDGKNIKITGYIQEYDGYPEIVINELSQVGIYNN